ncbi:MAG TPA: glycosyltransferase [Gemmatimonadales bacterium]|nr:glycosyltransferase [Gemmatimonadales bacterium]
MRILQTFFCEGGNAPPQLAVLRRLVERGHDVRALSHDKARAPVEERGATFVPFRDTLPGLDLSRPETDEVRDWEPRFPLAKAARFRDAAVRGPLVANALEVRRLLDEWAADGWVPDAVVLDILLLGTAAAGERAGVATVALSHCPYPLPVRGAPPLGSGLRPARGPLGRAREAALRAVTERFYAPALATLNEARSRLGLPPLDAYAQGLLGCDALLVMTAPELDFSSRGELPPNVHYTGPALEPAAVPWTSPWPADNADPLVLISFSTTYMNQRDFARRALQAVAGLPVRALLTTGPALDLAGIDVPANARVVPFAPHAAVLPHAALTVTHAGWATVQASLAAGVPLVCMPDARDQPDNAARVVEAGAGIRVRRNARPDTLRRAIRSALGDPALRAGAERMAAVLNRTDGADGVVDRIEQLAHASGDPVVAGPVSRRQSN